MAEYQIPTEEEYENRQFEQKDLQRIQEKNLSDLVDKWYDMNPEVEDLLWDWSELVEGMVVLIEDPMMKIDIRYPLSAEMLYQARTWNRWFMISHIVEIESNRINFMANYEDGSKRKFVAVAKSHSWLCKLEKPVVVDFRNLGPQIGVAKVIETKSGLEFTAKPFVVTAEDLDYGREETPGTTQDQAAAYTEPAYRGYSPTGPFYGFHDQPITDTAAQERIVQSRENKPNLKPAGSLYDQTAERWREEKGVHFPGSPFAEGPDDDSEKE